MLALTRFKGSDEALGRGFRVLPRMAWMPRVASEAPSGLDSHVAWVYHRYQDRSSARIAALRVEMGNIGRHIIVNKFNKGQYGSL